MNQRNTKKSLGWDKSFGYSVGVKCDVAELVEYHPKSDARHLIEINLVDESSGLHKMSATKHDFDDYGGWDPEVRDLIASIDLYPDSENRLEGGPSTSKTFAGWELTRWKMEREQYITSTGVKINLVSDILTWKKEGSDGKGANLVSTSWTWKEPRRE